jgi:hypothetical protein
MGAAMEIAGAVLVARFATGPCPGRTGPLEPNSCQVGIDTGVVLLGVGLPILANGAWMWPVGAKLVQREETARLWVHPWLATGSGSRGFGVLLAF